MFSEPCSPGSVFKSGWFTVCESNSNKVWRASLLYHDKERKRFEKQNKRASSSLCQHALTAHLLHPGITCTSAFSFWLVSSSAFKCTPYSWCLLVFSGLSSLLSTLLSFIFFQTCSICLCSFSVLSARVNVAHPQLRAVVFLRLVRMTPENIRHRISPFCSKIQLKYMCIIYTVLLLNATRTLSEAKDCWSLSPLEVASSMCPSLSTIYPDWSCQELSSLKVGTVPTEGPECLPIFRHITRQ